MRKEKREKFGWPLLRYIYFFYACTTHVVRWIPTAGTSAWEEQQHNQFRGERVFYFHEPTLRFAFKIIGFCFFVLIGLLLERVVRTRSDRSFTARRTGENVVNAPLPDAAIRLVFQYRITIVCAIIIVTCFEIRRNKYIFWYFANTEYRSRAPSVVPGLEMWGGPGPRIFGGGANFQLHVTDVSTLRSIIWWITYLLC